MLSEGLTEWSLSHPARTPPTDIASTFRNMSRETDQAHVFQAPKRKVRHVKRRTAPRLQRRSAIEPIARPLLNPESVHHDIGCFEDWSEPADEVGPVLHLVLDNPS